MKKKLTALLLCLVMALSLIPAVAFADIATGGTVWNIDSNGCLHIKGAVENHSYSSNETPWKNYVTQIKTVVTEDGAKITNGAYLFAGCTNLTSADLSHLDTTGVLYMGGMFSNCSSLKTVDLSSFDTSSVKEMYYMFNGCSSLTSLDLSGFKTSNVTLMHRMFYNCSSLTELDLGSFNTSKVESMYYMFYGCSRLRTLNVSSFDTAKVDSIDYMFYGCSSLTKLDLSHFKIAGVSRLDSMFEGCSGLTELDLSGFDTSKTNYMIKTFSGCSNLQSLDISNFSTAGVKNTGNFFSGCTALVKLSTNGDMIGQTKDQIIAISTEWHDKQSGAAYPNVTSLSTVSGKVTLVRPVQGSTADGWYLDSDGCLHITGMVTNSSSTSTDKTPWVEYKDQIKTVVAEDGAKVTNGIRLFAGCEDLTDVDLHKLNTFGITSMYMMFSGCSAVKTIDLSGFNTSKVEIMRAMFSGCTNLASLDISSFDASKVTNVLNMFKNCSVLAELSVSPSVLSHTADQLIAIGDNWRNKQTGTVYATEAALQAITGNVSLVRGYSVTFVTTDGVKVQYDSNSYLYSNGEHVRIPAGETVSLYANNMPKNMKLDDMVLSDGTPTQNGGTVCRYFTMPAHDVTVTVKLMSDNDLKGTVTISGECVSGATLTATLQNANSTQLIYRWMSGTTELGRGATLTVPEDFMDELTCKVSALDKVGERSLTVQIAGRAKHTVTFAAPYAVQVQYNGKMYADGDSVEVNEGACVVLYADNMPEGTGLDKMVLSDGTPTQNGGTICRYFTMPAHDVTVTVYLSGTPTTLLGDVNGDKSVNAADLTALLRHVAKIQLLTGASLDRANVNSDGTIDAADVTYLAKILDATA